MSVLAVIVAHCKSWYSCLQQHNDVVKSFFMLSRKSVSWLMNIESVRLLR